MVYQKSDGQSVVYMLFLEINVIKKVWVGLLSEKGECVVECVRARNWELE